MRLLNHPMQIRFQRQKTPSSCVAACLAMYTGEDQGEIIAAMLKYDRGCTGLKAEYRQWVRMGWMPTAIPFNEFIHCGGLVVLATVPSLNCPGGNHRILIDCQDASNPKVFDPNEGLLAEFEIGELPITRLTYVWDVQAITNDRHVVLHTWSELTAAEYCRIERAEV